MPVTFSSKHGAAQFFPILRIAGQNGVRAPVALTKAVCLIGRRTGVHLPLPAEQVSKIHALLVKQRDGVYLRDLASRNHVYVNGQPIREADLAIGDVVRIGPYTLQCASGFAEPDADKPPGLRATPAALESDDETSLLALESRAVLIGRRDECDVVLTAGDVAPIHAVLFELDGRRHLRDLDSASGTFVNGAQVHQHELSPGDELRIGDTKLRYVEVQGEAEIPADADADTADGSPAQEDLLELGTGLQDVFGASADLSAPDNYADNAGTGLDAMAPHDRREPELSVSESEHDDHDDQDHDDDELITLPVDPEHAEEDHVPPTGTPAPPQEDASIALHEEDEPSAAIPVSAQRDDADDHPELAHLSYEEDEPDHPDAVTPEMLEDKLPPNPAPAQAQGLQSLGTAPAPKEGLIPLVEGDRTVGVIDAAIQAAAEHWNDPVIARDVHEGEAFIHIPLVPVGGPDSAVGGLPLPPAAAKEGYGELESLTAVAPPEIEPQPEPELHKPLSPEETITPASGDDERRAKSDAAAPLGPAAASGAAAHPLFELVRELKAAYAEHKALDHPTPAESHETLRRSAVRRLDQLINDLSDLVGELKSTWQQVKLARPADPADGAKENPRN